MPPGAVEARLLFGGGASGAAGDALRLRKGDRGDAVRERCRPFLVRPRHRAKWLPASPSPPRIRQTPAQQQRPKPVPEVARQERSATSAKPRGSP